MNVSRQGSICAANGGNQLINQAKTNSNYLRRPSFDPAMLSLSLKNASPAVENLSTSPVSDPYQLQTFSSHRNSPADTPSRLDLDDEESYYKQSYYGSGNCTSPILRSAECAVTIEPPSDSSSPSTSPVKVPACAKAVSKLRKKHGVTTSSQSLPQSPSAAEKTIRGLPGIGRRRLVYCPKNRPLGQFRESKSLDKFPSCLRSGNSPSCATSGNYTAIRLRKLSKSLDIGEIDETLLLQKDNAEPSEFIFNNNNRAIKPGKEILRIEDEHETILSDQEQRNFEDGRRSSVPVGTCNNHGSSNSSTSSSSSHIGDDSATKKSSSAEDMKGPYNRMSEISESTSLLHDEGNILYADEEDEHLASMIASPLAEDDDDQRELLPIVGRKRKSLDDDQDLVLEEDSGKKPKFIKRWFQGMINGNGLGNNSGGSTSATGGPNNKLYIGSEEEKCIPDPNTGTHMGTGESESAV